MKRIWWLLVPAMLGGCEGIGIHPLPGLQWPDSSARMQTVQQGPPPQIDPKLPPAPKSAAQPESSQPAQQPTPAAPAATKMPPTAKLQRPTVSADQVNDGNAHEMAHMLWQEMELEYNTLADSGGGKSTSKNSAAPK